MFLLILLYALWGSSLPIAKWLLQFSPPILLAGTRMCAAGVLLLSYAYFFARSRPLFKSKYILAYVQIIFFGKYLRYVLKYWGLQHMSSVKVSFIVNSAPFFTAFFSYLMLKERLTGKQWLALITGFLGLLPVLLTTSSVEQLAGELFIFSWYECAIIIAVASCCYGIIVMRNIIRDHGSSLPATSGITMLGAGILALLTAFLHGEYIQSADLVPFFGWLALLIFISNVICHITYLYLLKRYSATFLSLTESITPFFTALYGWFFLHETITWHYYVSGLIISASLYLFYQDEL